MSAPSGGQGRPRDAVTRPRGSALRPGVPENASSPRDLGVGRGQVSPGVQPEHPLRSRVWSCALEPATRSGAEEPGAGGGLGSALGSRVTVEDVTHTSPHGRVDPRRRPAPWFPLSPKMPVPRPDVTHGLAGCPPAVTAAAGLPAFTSGGQEALAGGAGRRRLL